LTSISRFHINYHHFQHVKGYFVLRTCLASCRICYNSI